MASVTIDYLLGIGDNTLIISDNYYIKLYSAAVVFDDCDLVNIEQLTTTANVEQLATTANIEELVTTANIEQLATTANVEQLATTANIRCRQ